MSAPKIPEDLEFLHLLCSHDKDNKPALKMASLIERNATLEAALNGLLVRHNDGSAEQHWAEWDTAREVLAHHGESTTAPQPKETK